MKILLALDGSTPARAAVNAVKYHFWPPGTTIRVFTAASSTFSLWPEYDFIEYEALLRAAEKESESVAKQGAAELAALSAKVETVVRQGDPRHAIIEEARSWGADLIVLGSHGRTGLARALMGSVAEYVVRHAPCSVEVAREGGAHERSAEAEGDHRRRRGGAARADGSRP